MTARESQPLTGRGSSKRFARVEEARTRDDGGTGLGLSVTREIVEQHGGTISYDPDHDSGARFVVRLPAVDHRTLDT